MLGGMQDFELRVSTLLDHAAREHGAREIVTRWADGSETRSDWRGLAHDARRLAQALERMGIRRGDRVATLAMNHGHHLAAWYGTIGMGGVIHTINPRLFDDQLVYIANHAEDRVLFYDRAFQPIVDRLRGQWTSIERYVVMDGDGPGTLHALLEAEDGDYAWAEGSERDPCMLCYTSGTTGHPKGVLYEHRSTLLHAMLVVSPAVLALSSASVLLPVVPLFHAAAWGTPFAAPLAGAKLVFSAVNDAAVLCGLMNREGVTISSGVPTVWLAMFAHLDAAGTALPHLRMATIGGSAAPRAMIERLMDMGVEVKHLWGMTETSPVATAGAPPVGWADWPKDRKLDFLTKQGQIPFGVELTVIDDAGAHLPRDGASAGRLHIRGPWVVKRYFGAEADAIDADGWFDTGDVAVIHPDGTMQITDRSKDVIKSGGEWISSVELENAAVGCPGVAEAAAIGIAHPRWDERPLLVVVRKPDSDVDEGAIVAHLSGVVAKWWLPDAVVFVDSLPHTATGKLLKTALREQFRDYRLVAA
ncbi:long-chain fatty acid--CoA ligase [Sphingomonas sp. A2-49]|uniref:long-chain fatty acid--CoA ligase n=1 Tax=Sphingomonas sp. A2-49 TaxID=1391375 RepID=UPI0021CF27EA|nr:long-chain fatty acid--CoA ligase [Sphingomonas sp. A2-49]MCU6452704.1 long-chain fatty acid--CoA ligase [Sphingomonas sp. A2-49]